MKRFTLLLQLFMIGNKKSARNTSILSTSCSNSYTMHITKNNYTDTTSELEDLLTNKYSYRRKSLEGTDERISDDKNTTLHEQVILNLYKYALLKFLENKEVAESRKIEYIDEWKKMDTNSKYIPDITKGIVFSDW